MADIFKSVSKAFAANRDTRINYNIVEEGSTSLLTGIYRPDNTRTDLFYKRPNITGTGETTTAAVIYGEAMITPFIIDQGVESSTNDPASILRTYRFLTGDGPMEGIVVGPNGTPLQNVYTNDGTGNKPIVDSNGRPSLANVFVASALGGAITSAPKIWDLIKGSTPATSKTTTVDPVTGKPIPSASEQKALTTAAAINLTNLSDVSISSQGNNYVLVYDAEAVAWVAKPINTVLSETGAISIDGACGGKGGTGGTGGSGGIGGTGGAGGDGGSAGGTTPTPTTPCLPLAQFVKYPCDAPPAAAKAGMVLLPAASNTANNEYTQSIKALGTTGIEYHFFASGNGKKANWAQSNGAVPNCSPTGEFSCMVPADSNQADTPSTPGAEIDWYETGTFTVQICLTTEICGEEYLIYKSTITETALSSTSYSFIGATIPWSSTLISSLLTNYPGQVFNDTNPNVKIYLKRTDTCGSDYDIYFEGYRNLFNAGFYGPVTVPPTAKPGFTNPLPVPSQVKEDDGKFPDIAPAGGGLSAPSCPEEAVIPGTPGTPGLPGSTGGSGGAGSPGTEGVDGTCGTVAITTPIAAPAIKLAAPVAKTYGIQTTPPAFDAVTLPTATISSGIANTAISAVYSFAMGTGTFQLAGAIPGSVTSSIGSGTITLTGPAADVSTASAQVQIKPANGSGGEIHYKIIVENADGGKSGVASLLVPNQIVIKDSVAASAKVCVDVTSSGGTGKVKVTYNGSTKDLTAGFVAYTTNPTATAALIASNINGNIAFQNALPLTDPAWLPLFVATASSNEVTVTAPTAGGSEFNGVTLTTEVTPGFVFGACNGTFFGGITSTINNFLKNNVPNWDKVSNVLLGVAGNTLGAVAANVIMNGLGQEQISIPTDGDAVITFLYRGRKVQVPNEYNAAARTGHPTYAGFSGIWKTQWTQNPAWCLYDYITNKKFGLGIDLQMSPAQEALLLQDIFKIGLRCDELVDTLPRFSINTVITSGSKLDILEQLCSVFWGGYGFVNGGLRLTYDHLDTDIKFLVNQSNASNFEKVFTNAKNYTNKVKLTYVEPSNFYTNEVVIAENSASIDVYGERVVESVLFGCTNADEAVRYATWILQTEQDNSINISYTGAFDHYNLMFGDIVEYYDSNERGIRRAGRIRSQSGTAVVLDAPIAAIAGDNFSLTTSDGAVHQTTIASISGVNVVLTTAPGVSAIPNATYIAASSTIGRKLYKVIKVDETDTLKFSVTLQLYNPDKY